MKRILIVVLAVLVALTVLGCGKGKEEGKAEKAKGEAITAKMPQEMSTTVVSSVGGHAGKVKLYMKADRMRMESDAAAGAYTIVRRDLKKMWMVMPSTKSYMEMAEVKEDVPVPEEKVKGEVSRKVVGSDTVDGHPCTKYEVTAKVGEKAVTSYQWWATDINFPIKAAALDGSWNVEYKDIKIGSQPDSLFELPAGYQKMSMPTMPRGVGKK
jgi:outer membrane lipoprotein-sorting protein